MPPGPTTTIERDGRAAIVHLRGDLVVPVTGEMYGRVRAIARPRDVDRVTLDFSDAGRLDSSGIAVVSLLSRQLARDGKVLELTALRDHHRAALELVPKGGPEPPVVEPPPGALERVGEGVLRTGDTTRGLYTLLAETAHQAIAVAARRARLPVGVLGTQIVTMGVNAIFIVGLLSALLGMTFAFQGAVQLRPLGAGAFVADMVALLMVREVGPLMTAVILTGRTGAAIAAELGTMRVRSEIDALATMGIDPVRFLIVPRVTALTMVLPALSLAAMYIGVLGGMLVAQVSLELSPSIFWQRTVARLDFGDFTHGLGKSVLFAWIIGITASHLGLRTRGDASSVGAATTRTVVVSVFCIIIVDAGVATLSSLMEGA